MFTKQKPGHYDLFLLFFQVIIVLYLPSGIADQLSFLVWVEIFFFNFS